MPHIKSLDGLRGAAAFLVVFAHASSVLKFGDNILGGGVGQMGVMIFFTLSGFLMAFLYFDRPIGLPAIGKFYWRRMSRVYPLFAFLVLFFFAITVVLFDGEGMVFDLDLPLTIQHLTLQTGIGPLWTIPVEIMFYLFVPLFWLAYQRAGFAGLLGLIALVLIAQTITGFRSYLMPLNKVSLTAVVHFFLFGFLAWVLYRVTDKIAGNRNWLLPLFDIGFVVGVLMLVPMFPRVFESLTGVKTALWKPSMYIAYVPALLFFTAKSRLAQATLGSTVPAFLGKISYSVYVWHFPCLVAVAFLRPIWKHPLAGMPIAIALIIVVSTLSYLLIEKPSRTFLNSLLAKRKTHSAVSQAVKD